MVFPDLTLGLQRFSASDSILRRRKEERIRLLLPQQLRGLRPILFFVDAEKNGSACSDRSGNEVCVRFCFLLPQRRTVPPAERHYPTAAVIPDFRGQTWESLQGNPQEQPNCCIDS